jgi:hypothetical protein
MQQWWSGFIEAYGFLAQGDVDSFWSRKLIGAVENVLAGVDLCRCIEQQVLNRGM